MDLVTDGMERDKSQRSCLGHGSGALNLLTLAKGSGHKYTSVLYREDQEQVLSTSRRDHWGDKWNWVGGRVGYQCASEIIFLS